MAARSGLALRISLLTVAVAVITALVAGLIAVETIQRSDDAAARQTLARLAVAAQSEIDTPVRTRAALRALNVASGVIGKAGRVTSDNTYVRDALTATEIAEVLSGGSLTRSRTVDGVQVLLAATGSSSGGVIVLQRRADARAFGDTAIRRVLLALVIAVALAIVLGLIVAWRLAQPLRRARAAAHALAGGRRDVIVAVEGPAEIAEVAEALNLLSASLAHSEARQRDFLLSVSHDLRTPLTAISGYAESLADGMIAPDQTGRVGQVMLDEAQRLSRLVADLLDLARLDAQDVRIEAVPVELAGWLDTAGAAWAARCRAEGVPLVVERPPFAITVVTDPTRLRQVLDGLVENALRITPAGRPIVVAVRPGPTQLPGSSAVVEVRDGGPGLRDADLVVAFDRSALYERYRGVRKVGTGLGLAIVHRLVTRLGGTIEAGHASEGGARFTVVLPAVPVVAPGR